MKKDVDEKEQVRVLENVVARDIVKTIMDFGVNQQQILQIINLLALELEDNNLMRSINGLCKNDKTEKLHV